MNKPYLVSTVIPNYNNAPYIRECVESLLAQTYDHIEIIITDDASTDGSQDIIRSLEQEYDKVSAIYNTENMGITRNRKQALLQANGEYINYLDSDDFIQNPEKLACEMELIDYYRQRYDEDVIAFSNVDISDGDGHIVNRFRDTKPAKEGYIINELICRRCLIPQNFTFRQQIYLDIGGHDVEIPFYENWDLKIRFSKQYQHVFTGVPGFVYRRHGTGLSMAHVERHRTWVRKIAEKNFHLIEPEAQSYVRGLIEEMVNHIDVELNFINSHLPDYSG